MVTRRRRTGPRTPPHLAAWSHPVPGSRELPSVETGACWFENDIGVGIFWAECPSLLLATTQGKGAWRPGMPGRRVAAAGAGKGREGGTWAARSLVHDLRRTGPPAGSDRRLRQSRGHLGRPKLRRQTAQNFEEEFH